MRRTQSNSSSPSAPSFPKPALIPEKYLPGAIARFRQARVVLRAPRDKAVPPHLRNFFRDPLGAKTLRRARRNGSAPRLPRHLCLEQVGRALDATAQHGSIQRVQRRDGFAHR